MAGIVIKGIKDTIRLIDHEYNAKRRLMNKISVRVSEDLLRKARGNAPVKTGDLRDSGSSRVNDMGRGNGFVIKVGFDTPYALKMHEKHYQAHDPHDKHGDKTRQTLRFRRGGVKATQEIMKRTTDGMWIDSQGRKHGRKYLQRALDENIGSYRAAFKIVGDK